MHFCLTTDIFKKNNVTKTSTCKINEEKWNLDVFLSTEH